MARLIYVCSAFSGNMMSKEIDDAGIAIRRLTEGEVRPFLDAQVDCYHRRVVPAVGNKALCPLIEKILGRPDLHSSTQIMLEEGDKCLVAHYDGPKIPEGATEVPEGGKITWMLYTIR